MSETCTSTDFANALRKFVEIAQSVIDDNWDGDARFKSILSIDPKGKRYARIVRNDASGQSVYCFVDKTNGDILKAASWKTPAKHARGNIFDENPGDAITEYGAKYLR